MSIDALVVAGDLADSGLVRELKAVADGLWEAAPSTQAFATSMPNSDGIRPFFRDRHLFIRSFFRFHTQFIRRCVEWLRDAGIVTPCYAMQFPELPIRGNDDETRFKLYMADTGLLVSMLDDETQADLRANGNLGGYKGGLCENIVGEALSKSGADLVYYKRDDSTLEEDFFLRTATRLVPVEVKAANPRSKSLRTLIASDHYPDIGWGVKLSNGNVGFENGILTLPRATAFLLKRLLGSGK